MMQEQNQRTPGSSRAAGLSYLCLIGCIVYLLQLCASRMSEGPWPGTGDTVGIRGIRLPGAADSPCARAKLAFQSICWKASRHASLPVGVLRFR